MWSDAAEAEPSISWVELPENGWGALMGWAAGCENLRRHPQTDEGRTVTVYTERDGAQGVFEEPFTAGDRHVVDDDIDAYLREGGLPPRPRGYAWMIRVPADYAFPEAFLARVESAILRAAGSIVDPKLLLPVFESVLRDFYAKDI